MTALRLATLDTKNGPAIAIDVGAMNRQHDNFVVRGPVVDCIRESQQYGATGLEVNAVEQERVISDCRDQSLDGLTELAPQFGAT